MHKLVAIILSLCLLVGCSANVAEPIQNGNSSSSEPVEEVILEVSEDEKIETVTIDYLSQGLFSEVDGVDVESKIIEDFMLRNPDVIVNIKKVDYDKAEEYVLNAKEKSELPNITFTTAEQSMIYAENDCLRDLTATYVANDDSWYSELRQSVNYNSAAIMIPISVSPYTMVFNYTLLETLGLEDRLPEGSWNLEEYKALLEDINEALGITVSVEESEAVEENETVEENNTDDETYEYYTGVIPLGSLSGERGNISFIQNLYNTKVFDTSERKLSFNSEDSVKAGNWIAELCENKLLIDGTDMTYSEALEDFESGKSAHIIQYSLFQMLTSGLKSEYTFVAVPYPSNGDAEYAFSVMGVSVFNTGDYSKDDAVNRLINYMSTDPEAVRLISLATAGCPNTSTLIGLYSDVNCSFYESCMDNLAHAFWTYDEWSELSIYVSATLSTVTDGTLTADAAFEIIDALEPISEKENSEE